LFPVAGLSRVSWLAAIVCLAVVSDPAAAQSPGRITGRILDGASGNPVEGAVVVLNPLDRQVFTNDAGVFILRDLPEGTYTIRVSHLSFEDHTTSVRVASGETTQVEIVLDRKPIATDTLNVRVERKPAYLERMGYYRRLERGWGTFLGPAWVESRNRGFTRADQFVHYVKAQAPALGCNQTPVYLDGRRIRNEPSGGGRARNNNDLLAEMSSNGIGAVEVYASGNWVPIFALNDTTLVCGAVVMWSKRWTDEQEVPQIEVVLCQAVGTGGGVTLDGVVRDELTRVVLPGARVTLLESSAVRGVSAAYDDRRQAGPLSILRSRASGTDDRDGGIRGGSGRAARAGCRGPGAA